jgi:hypothetical protein
MPDQTQGFTSKGLKDAENPNERSQLMRFPHPKLNYANVIATIALFVALGGAAVAAGLPKNSVGQKQLKRGAVTAAKLKRGAVTSGKIAPQAVTAGKLGANAVLPGNLGNGIITTNKLSDGAVIASKIKNGVVTTNKLDNGAVTAAKLGDNAVTSAKLANGSVTLSKLAPGVPPLPSTLPSKQTERGMFDIGGDLTFTRTGVSYPISLGFYPEGQILEVGESSPQCPGRALGPKGEQLPQASPGHLCVYIALREGKTPSLALDTASNTNLGFGVTATFSEPDLANRILAFWAVTAP